MVRMYKLLVSHYPQKEIWVFPGLGDNGGNFYDHLCTKKYNNVLIEKLLIAMYLLPKIYHAFLSDVYVFDIPFIIIAIP